MYAPVRGSRERLARLRKARGDTQTELGEILDLSRRMMTYYEREDGRPPARQELPASDRRAVIKLVDGLLASQKLNSRGTRIQASLILGAMAGGVRRSSD